MSGKQQFVLEPAEQNAYPNTSNPKSLNRPARTVVVRNVDIRANCCVKTPAAECSHSAVWKLAARVQMKAYSCVWLRSPESLIWVKTGQGSRDSGLGLQHPGEGTTQGPKPSITFQRKCKGTTLHLSRMMRSTSMGSARNDYPAPTYQTRLRSFLAWLTSDAGRHEGIPAAARSRSHGSCRQNVLAIPSSGHDDDVAVAVMVTVAVVASKSSSSRSTAATSSNRGSVNARSSCSNIRIRDHHFWQYARTVFVGKHSKW